MGSHDVLAVHEDGIWTSDDSPHDLAPVAQSVPPKYLQLVHQDSDSGL